MADGAHPFFDTSLAERLSAFALLARGPRLGSVSGRHQSPHRGSSVEFAEYRRYQPGDDLRRLDWRAFGRTDRYYVKEFEADTNLRLTLVLDASGSMAFENKMHVARQVAATLAYIAIGQGDAAGLVCCGADAEPLAPRRNPGQVSLIFERLRDVQPEGPTRLEQTLHELGQSLPRRGLVVVISDLLCEPALLRRGLEHLAFQHHDVALFHIAHPDEWQPRWDRPVRLQDLESEHSVLVDPDDIADQYRTAVREYLDELTEITRQTSTDYHRVLVDEPLEPALVRFFAGRGGEAGR